MKYYDLLEVPPDASAEQIKAAYRILVQLHHPDRLQQVNPSVRQYAEEKLKRINEAYTVLSDPSRRAAYDARYVRRRAKVPVDVDEVDEDEPTPRRARRTRAGKRAAYYSDEDLAREADELLRREAERQAAEQAAERVRQRAAAAERARREAEEQLRRTAQTQYPRLQPTPQGFTLHLAAGMWTPLRRVPAGEFCMGSDPARDPQAHPQEQPQHLVYLSEYAISQYPITNAHYAVFAKAQHRVFSYTPGLENIPVTGVAWDDAVAFCRWLSQRTGNVFRLPTEAEWEKAARGPDGRLYPWGDDWDPSRVSAGALHNLPAPIGLCSPLGDSVFGISDMSGNVWEWCADWFDARAYVRRVANSNGRMVQDPLGPATGEGCVVRGGAFDSPPKHARCAHRNWYYPHNTRANVGFRIVLEVS